MSLQELVEAADNLSKRLEIASENEKKYCYDLQNTLEKYSWELYRMTNDLKEIMSELGV